MRKRHYSSGLTAAGVYAARNESLFGWIAGEWQCAAEVLVRSSVAAALQLQLAECHGIERIRAQPLAAGDRVNCCEPLLGTGVLRNGNRPVELNHRRRPDAQQGVIQSHYLRPVGGLCRGCGCMAPGNGRFDVVLTQLVAGGGTLQQALTFLNELPVPLGAILVWQQAQTAPLVYPGWHSSGVQAHQCQQCERRWRRGEWMIAKQSGQTHCFATQLHTDRRFRVGPVVTLIEQQV